MNNEISNQNDVDTPPLTVDTLEALWTKTYNTSGKPDWSHIYPYYHDSIIFQDTIQRLEGKDNFKAMCNRLTKRCKSLRMDIFNVAQKDNIIIMEWKMTMSFRRSPDTPIYGCTKLTLNENGQILEQRDYYDLWGDIYNGIPVFGKVYRKVLHMIFG